MYGMGVTRAASHHARTSERTRARISSALSDATFE